MLGFDHGDRHFNEQRVLISLREESKPRGLKPSSGCVLDVRTKVRTYLRSNGNGKGNGKGKGEGRSSAFGEG